MPIKSELERARLVGFLDRSGCEVIRESNKHLFYCNREGKRFSSVPRQDMIGPELAAKILSDLGLGDAGL